MLNAKKIKEDFPIFENYRRETGADLAYLDSAASSQTPREVVGRMDDYYFKFRSNIHRSAYKIGEEATNKYEEARNIVARFINAEPDEVIFTGGATASSNMLIYALEGMLDLKTGYEVLTSIAEHHSNLVPLQELARRKGLTLKHFSITPDFRLDLSGLDTLITPKTKIVSVTLASNVTGEIVDATKAAGHTPIDVKALGCDFMFFSGHKMCGPTGIGVLYGRRELLDKMQPSFFGGGIVEDATIESADYNKAPARFEPGTPNIAGAIGLAAAIKYLERIGIEEIKKHSEELVSRAISKLSQIAGVKLVCERDPRRNIGIVSFVVEGIHPHDVGEILNRGHVSIRGGHHCAMPLMKMLGASAVNRASFYVYNDESDVDRLASGIEKAKSIFN